MTLSIIIINYNTFELTSKCIESIFRFTKNVDFEIILVDNASVECNPDVFLEKFPQITLVKSSENRGFAGGNNVGLEIAKGEYILLLNSDTELVENSIETSLNRLKQDLTIGVLSCKLIYPDGKIQSCANKFPSISLEIKELLRLQKFISKSKSEDMFLGAFFDHQTEKNVDWVWGTFFLTKRKIINQFPSQKLPDDFFMYFEDVQWCYKIRQLGYEILYFPTTKIIHHLSASSAGNKDIFHKMSKSLINECVFLRKEKGSFYTYILYILRTIKYFSLRKPEFTRIAKFYYKFIKNKLRLID